MAQQLERMSFRRLSFYDTKIKAWVTVQITKNKPDLSKYFNAPPVFNSETRKIEFYHDSVKVAELDATPFIIDGMVDDVELTIGSKEDNQGKPVLKIAFNTDSKKDPIEIPLEKIFNPENYYNKEQVDAELKKYVKNETLEGYVKISDIVEITTEQIDSLFPSNN